MKETELYEPVRAWVERHFHCWETGINTGPKVGRIDVVGVRDVGGDLSGRSEVIAVEVKAGVQAFATSAGQAHGYSVMADRCYLADLRDGQHPYSAEELLIAGRLGVGLLAISTAGRIREIQTAPPAEPVEEFRLQVIEKCGLALCSLCSTLFRRSTDHAKDFKGVTRSSDRNGVAAAARKGRGYMWWLDSAARERDRRPRMNVYWRRYLCADCVWALGPEG